MFRVRTIAGVGACSSFVALGLVGACTQPAGSNTAPVLVVVPPNAQPDAFATTGLDSGARMAEASHDAGQQEAATEAGLADAPSVTMHPQHDAGTFESAGDAVSSERSMDGGSDTAKDGGKDATGTGGDAATATGGDASLGTPALVYIGRFDTSDPVGPQMGWPGARVVARFDGTAATVQLTQTDGYSGGPSYFNVFIDGVESTPFSLEGASVVVPLASGLSAGEHVLELEKRTVATLGTVRFEGFTFKGGTGLLPPLPRAPHRIEFMSDSTIDGYGVLGNTATTCPTGDPPQYNDSHNSFASFTATASNAEMVLSAYSGKGLTVDEDTADTEFYQILFPRALPDDPASVWTFHTDVPDAVVMSLGGVDMDGLAAAPAGFQTSYDSFVGTVRGHYPTAAIWLTVWSQITNDPVATRTAMTNALQAIVTARSAAGDHNLFLYVFPEATAADGTGCEGHATAAHEQAMAALMTTEIQTRLGW